MRRREGTDEPARVVIVTGAGSGIGRGTAGKFAAEGWRVTVNDVDESRARDTVAGLPGEVLASVGDVSEADYVREMVAATVEEFGRLDAMIANAGVPDGAPILGHDVALWDRVMAVNLRGAMLCGKYAAQAMVELGQTGAIVMVGSIFADVTEDAAAAYCASKGGMTMLTRSMAYELGKHGIRVNQVDPAFIRTAVNPLDRDEDLRGLLPTIPMGRVGTPEDCADVIHFFASDASRYVTGASLVVDGGFMTSHSITIDRSNMVHAGTVD